MALRARLYRVLEEPGDSLAGRLVSGALALLILTNVVALMVETVPGLYKAYRTFFRAFEFASVLVFTTEYALRLWVAAENPKYRRPLVGRVRFAFTFFAIVDLLAILPFYLPLLPIDLRSLRTLRLLRLARVAKLGRHSQALQLVGRVFREKLSEMLTVTFLVLVAIILSGSLMYFAENRAQPEAFPSIPHALWWAVATLTTVGYGDVYPITWVGKALATVVVLLGVGILALPTGILTAGLMDAVRKADRTCPHCGKPLGR